MTGSAKQPLEGTDTVLLAISHVAVGTEVLVTTYAGSAAEVGDGGNPVNVALASSSPRELLHRDADRAEP